jgi:eps5K
MIYLIFNEHWEFFNKDIEKSLKKISVLKEQEIKILKIRWKVKENLFGKIIRRICFKLGKIKNILDYSQLEKKDFSKNDYIIFFDIFEKGIVDLLRKKTKNTKEIFWIWNKIDYRHINELKRISKNVWTFDKIEAENTKIKYSSQFYWRKKEEINEDEIYDLYFIGQNKGREQRIFELKKKFNNFKFKIIIILNKYRKEGIKYFFKKKASKLNYSLKNIPYECVVEDIKKSKIILELTKKEQSGLTLRALEALFFEKKLITDNENIKEYDFYNSNNIFILKNNDILDSKKEIEIQEFFYKEKEIIDQRIKDKYTIKSWLENLINGYIEE